MRSGISIFPPRATRTFCGIAGGGAGAITWVIFFLSADCATADHAAENMATAKTAKKKGRRQAMTGARNEQRKEWLRSEKYLPPATTPAVKAGVFQLQQRKPENAHIVIAASERLLYLTTTFAHEIRRFHFTVRCRAWDLPRRRQSECIRSVVWPAQTEDFGHPVDQPSGAAKNQQGC